MNGIKRALDHLLRATGDPLRDLSGIEPGHPEGPQAAVIRAAVGVMAKVPDALPGIARAIGDADVPGLAPRLRAHLEAAERWIAGDAEAASRRYADVVAHWPNDLLAMRLVVSCNFFIGRPESSCALIDGALQAWSADEPEFGFALAMAAFVHAECGDPTRAEALGRQALARDRRCPIGIHAVAHAMAEAGQPGRGARWMRAQRDQWAVPSRMRTHNAWHLAMFELADGHPTPALDILDHCLVPAARTSPVDACDASALLWSLAAQGLDLGSRWRVLSEVFDSRWQPGFWPFVDIHAVLAHLRAGAGPRIDRLTRVIDGLATENSPVGRRSRTSTVPVIRAIERWRAGESLFDPPSALALRNALRAAGGSRLQREIFATLERPAPCSALPAAAHREQRTREQASATPSRAARVRPTDHLHVARALGAVQRGPE